MRDLKAPTIEKHLRDVDIPFISTKHSHQGHFVPSIVRKYASPKWIAQTFLKVGDRLFGSIIEMLKSYRNVKNNQYLGNKIIDKETLTQFEEYAKSLGIDKIGYTKVNPDYIFKDRKILFENAIVLVMEMKRDKIDQAPSLETNKEIFRTYHELGKVVNKLASLLIELGFNAQAGPALGGDINYVMTACDANLGMIGNHGLLITEEFGPSLRLAALYTDIDNLPFTSNKDHEWILGYCKKCKMCVNKCPAGAIYNSPKDVEIGGKRNIDYKKCAVPFSNDYGCTLCVKHCAFYTGSYKQIKNSIV
jgi:epoxyqueuosine reductase